VNEISVPNFLHPLITCIVLFFTQNVTAIVNKTANFKRSKFASSAVSNLSLQKKRIVVQLTVYIT